jgi:predicted amidophosphoribosyltransferase
MAGRLADLLAHAIQAAGVGCEAIVHVPMHWQRRLLRGHDHAEQLAALLAKRLELPSIGALRRTRSVSPQVHLPRTRRIENVRGSMALARGQDLSGLSILLVDDVTTTGATADEAARVCLSGGAEEVILAVAAKAEPPRAYAQGKQLR